MTSTARPTASPDVTRGDEHADDGHLEPRLRTFLYVLFAALGGLLDLPLSGVGLGLVGRFSGAEIPVLVPVLAVVSMSLLLLQRSRFPLTVLLATLAISGAINVLIADAQVLGCALVAIYTAASRTSRRFALPVLGLALVHGGLVTASALLTYVEPMTASAAIAPTVAFSVIVFTAWAFGRLEAARTARTLVLTDELARATAATQAERQRIARELHDILAHSVSAMMMQAAGARAVADAVAQDRPDDRFPRVVDALGNIESIGSQSLRELHRLLGVMRESATTNPLDLDTDPPGSSNQPSLDDLEELVQMPRKSGLIVQLHRSGEHGTLDPSVGAAAYRVVQESLTNALKHAGRGSVVDIYESWEDGTVQLQVRSRAGSRTALRPDTPSSGTGLRGLRERVQLAGGTFEAAAVGDEFVTTTRLPVSGHPTERQ